MPATSVTPAVRELCELWASGEAVTPEQRDRFYSRHPSGVGTTPQSLEVFETFRNAALRRFEVLLDRNPVYSILSWPFQRYETNAEVIARVRVYTTNHYLNLHATYRVEGTHIGHCYRPTPHNRQVAGTLNDLFFHQILNGQVPHPASVDYPEGACNQCATMACYTCHRTLETFSDDRDRMNIALNSFCLEHTPFVMNMIQPQTPKFKGIYAKNDVLRKTLKGPDAVHQMHVPSV